jgi:hypothetical protein
LLASVEVSEPDTILVKWDNGRVDRAKHWIIAAKLGEENAVGFASKRTSSQLFVHTRMP